MDWFLYDNGLRLERVNKVLYYSDSSTSRFINTTKFGFLFLLDVVSVDFSLDHFVYLLSLFKGSQSKIKFNNYYCFVFSVTTQILIYHS